MKRKKNTYRIPADWHGPMKECAKMLRGEGVKTTWNSRLVKQAMLWGLKNLLFYKIHHGPRKKPQTAYVLVSKGTFIAAFRFRPKRIHVPAEKAYGGRGYYAWTDCNGPKYGSLKGHPANTIEGSMNARCVKMTITI